MRSRLPELFGELVVPQAVYSELQSAQAPQIVRDFVLGAPDWLKVRLVAEDALERVSEAQLHRGEREAIALAETLRADYLIMDERTGRRLALRRQLVVIGTLGILDKADAEGLIEDFPALLERLEQTSFRITNRLVDELVRRHGARREL